jgi:hypothetical protein
VKITNPAQPGLAALGERDPATHLVVKAMAAIPIGTFTKKIHRQDRPEVSAPPIGGPRPLSPAPAGPSETKASLDRCVGEVAEIDASLKCHSWSAAER